MIVLDIEQGSEEWFIARAGIPTASNFKMLVTSKGEPSKQRQKYLYTLAGEKIIGKKEESYQNAAMTRGIELESEARALYEISSGNKVQTVGICYKDENKQFSCSPDGLIGEDGGLEIKCPSLAVHVEYLINNKLPTEYLQQVQGSMFVTGRKWWDFMSYYPAIKPFYLRVNRDEKFILSLQAEMEKFCKELKKTVLNLN